MQEAPGGTLQLICASHAPSAPPPPVCRFLYGDLLLVLCAALRKCSTPRSAGSSSGRGVGRYWHHPRCSCTISVLFTSLTRAEQQIVPAPLCVLLFLCCHKKHQWCKSDCAEKLPQNEHDSGGKLARLRFCFKAAVCRVSCCSVLLPHT